MKKTLFAFVLLSAAFARAQCSEIVINMQSGGSSCVGPLVIVPAPGASPTSGITITPPTLENPCDPNATSTQWNVCWQLINGIPQEVVDDGDGTGYHAAPAGPPGSAATINFQTPVLLPPGSTPTATNSGSQFNAIITLGIPAGAPGLPGSPGSPGAPGNPGNNGLNGTNGATWRYGTTSPSNSLGADGDFYLKSTGDVYQRSNGTYSRLMSLMGPTGPPNTLPMTVTIKCPAGSGSIAKGFTSNSCTISSK